MVVDMRRVTPATDLNIESLGEIRAGFIVNATHPLAAKRVSEFSGHHAVPGGIYALVG